MPSSASCETPIRVGLIGCGQWGRNYLRVLGELEGCRLVAAADIEPARFGDLPARHPGVAFSSEPALLVDDETCDAVVIASPAASHGALVRAALAAGLDVLVEKPLALDPAEALELARLATERGRILLVAHTFLFNGGVRTVKQCLDDGLAGEIFYLRMQRTQFGTVREDVNAVWDLAPHDVSICLYLLGSAPTSVQAAGSCRLRSGREDAAFINLTFPGGVLASIHVSWVDTNKVRRMEIVGSKAKIVFDDLDAAAPVRIHYPGNGAPEPVVPALAAREPLAAQCEEFLADCRLRRQPRSGGELGAAVVRVLSEIDRALARGR